MIVELHHPTDPRFLLVEELPERVTLDDLGSWRFGKPLLFAAGDVDAVYVQPAGPGTDWVRPRVIDDATLESVSATHDDLWGGTQGGTRSGTQTPLTEPNRDDGAEG